MGYRVKMPVRSFVEFLLQRGDIDARLGGSDRALEGAKIHRRLQKEGGSSYRAEQFLSITTELDGFTYQLEGRADGIIETDQGVMIDEIKTTALPLSMLTEDFQEVHWAQAKCYGYIYGTQNQLDRILLRLTYFQVDTEEIRQFHKEFSLAELEAFYLDLLHQYEPWARFRMEWEGIRTASAKGTAFPFAEYRRGQREMAVAVYRTIQREKRLFCQAPTGIGKTISVLFPSIKAMGEGLSGRIFYLTAKTVTRQSAEQALSLLREKGLRVKAVTLTAKEKICFRSETSCNPDDCPYAKGHYDRVNDAVYRFLQQEDFFTREKIEEWADANRVCPFEFTLDLSLWCDVIICDYNYLFDPVVYLKRFFDRAKTDAVFLIDEAHNLPDRARDMYSAGLQKSDFLALKRKARETEQKSLARALQRINREMRGLKEFFAEGEKVFTQPELPEHFISELQRTSSFLSEWLEDHKGHELRADVLSLFFDIRFFLRIAELYDDHFITCINQQGSNVILRLLCLDPSKLLDACMARGKASVLFSATLSPMDYFSEILGGGEGALHCMLPSPFPQENRGLFIAGNVSTKYKDREASLAAVSEYLCEMVSGRPGNYMAYFPSYLYMQQAAELFQSLYPEIPVLLQQPHMDEAQRLEFLERFREDTEGTLLGFCVLGGIYAEGIDLSGDRLIGTAIVGVGLPQVNWEQEILREYYKRTNGRGFQFAYQYPGMNKVLQAAGRVIRSPQDRGVILLIDSRFEASDYRRLFPPHWNDAVSVRSAADLREHLRRFWKKTPHLLS